MPNWCNCNGTVIIAEKDYEAFKKMFHKHNRQTPLTKEECDNMFYRTFCDYIEEYTVEEGYLDLYFEFDCAWSFYSCMIEKSEGVVSKTIFDAIKELDIKRISFECREYGMQFIESFYFNKETNECKYECKDMPYYRNAMNEEYGGCYEEDASYYISALCTTIEPKIIEDRPDTSINLFEYNVQEILGGVNNEVCST